jgi:hypothetical protein
VRSAGVRLCPLPRTISGRWSMLVQTPRKAIRPYGSQVGSPLHGLQHHVLMQVERAGEEDVVVRLTYDEALVLSDFLDRWSRTGFERAIEVTDRAESLLLDNLCASFERVIDEVFAADYQYIVEAARRRVAAATDSD